MGFFTTLGKNYANLAKLAKQRSSGLFTLNDQIQPVVIVDDIRDVDLLVGNQGTPPSTQGTGGTQATGVVATNPPFTAVWVNGTTQASINNNTGLNTYYLHFVQGYKFRLEKLIMTWKTDTAPLTTAGIVGAYIYAGEIPVTGATINFWNPSQLWNTNPEVAQAASTSYYALHDRKIKVTGTEDTPEHTDFPSQGQTARTLWNRAPLPDIWVNGPGGIGLLFRAAAAAGGGFSEVSWRALITLDRP